MDQTHDMHACLLVFFFFLNADKQMLKQLRAMKSSFYSECRGVKEVREERNCFFLMQIWPFALIQGTLY